MSFTIKGWLTNRCITSLTLVHAEDRGWVEEGKGGVEEGKGGSRCVSSEEVPKLHNNASSPVATATIQQSPIWLPTNGFCQWLTFHIFLFGRKSDSVRPWHLVTLGNTSQKSTPCLIHQQNKTCLKRAKTNMFVTHIWRYILFLRTSSIWGTGLNGWHMWLGWMGLLTGEDERDGMKGSKIKALSFYKEWSVQREFGELGNTHY